MSQAHITDVKPKKTIRDWVFQGVMAVMIGVAIVLLVWFIGKMNRANEIIEDHNDAAVERRR
jgi:hypothetical protein